MGVVPIVNENDTISVSVRLVFPIVVPRLGVFGGPDQITDRPGN